MSKKYNGNIFETFEASLVVLSIALVKLHFTKSALAAMFFYQFLLKINRVPLISIVNDCTKFEDINQSSLDLECIQAIKLGGGHLKNKKAETNVFSKVVPLDPKIKTGNLNLISILVLL